MVILLVQYYIIATDNAYEQERGTGRYEHQIYLIELTKIAEGYIGDNMTFTNALGNNFTEGNNFARLDYTRERYLDGSFIPATASDSVISSFFPGVFSLKDGKVENFPTDLDVFNKEKAPENIVVSGYGIYESPFVMNL